MAKTVSLTGKDTVAINGRILVDFPDGDNATITFPNDLMSVKTGKNGNSIYAFNESGKQCDVQLRIMRGSEDDKFLQSLLSTMQRDVAAFTLLTGQFVKRLGDGEGNVINDRYQMSGGVFQKPVEASQNVEGDTEQSISVYMLQFTNAPRTLGG